MRGYFSAISIVRDVLAEATPHPSRRYRGDPPSPTEGIPRKSRESSPRLLHVPLVPEHVSVCVLGFRAKAPGAVGHIREAQIGIFRDRDAAFHREHGAVVLRQP